MSEVDAFTQTIPSLNASQVLDDDDDHGSDGSDGSGGGTSHCSRNAQDSCSAVTEKMPECRRIIGDLWDEIVPEAQRLDAFTCVKHRSRDFTGEAQFFQISSQTQKYEEAVSRMKEYLQSLPLRALDRPSEENTAQGRRLASYWKVIALESQLRHKMLLSLPLVSYSSLCYQCTSERNLMTRKMFADLMNDLSAERVKQICTYQSDARQREQIEGSDDIVEEKWNGRLRIAILPTGEMGHFVTDPWCDFTPMEKLSKYVPSARSLKPSDARILDCSNMSEWPEVGPGWEHRHFTKKILQQLRSHALIYVASKHKEAIKRSSKQAASERNRLWNNRYLVTDQEIQSCIQEGMMRDLIEDLHYTFVTRTGRFVNAYQDEWERKARLMADDAHSLAAQLLTSDAQECILEAIQHTRNDDLLSCFASVCRQDTWRALKSVDETLATNQGSQEMVEKALSEFEAVVKDAESKMQELRDNDYGKALRKELTDHHRRIDVPASLVGLIKYFQEVPKSQSAPSTTTAEPPAA